MEKIVVQNLYKIFGSHPEKALKMLEQGSNKDEIMEKLGNPVGVDDVSFDVKQGEIVVVMGLSGSGKSTLVRCINRLFEPTAGKITVDGTDVIGLDQDELMRFRRAKFGMVFQNFALFPHRRVVQNVEFGLEVQKEEPEKMRKKAMDALEMVGLKGWENSYPQELSGGMQQRVGLARAIALDPDILLMDEAFSALDPLIRRDMQDELLKLQEAMHKTIVFISHDLDEALKLGDRIVLMKDGKVVQIGTSEEILTAPATEYVAKFVEEVDITKVLTAESVMKKTEAVAHLKTDGPRASLRKMRKNAISSLFVVDEDHKVVGVLTADDAAALAKTDNRDLREIMKTDFKTVSPETSATDLFPMLQDIPYPLVVADENGRLLGVIVRGQLIGAIAERGGNE
ncbi:MAG: glycine betaine/L-proline ABC transporter ATP-binding protein [Desulfonatronovibrionaceae bacterium]